MFLIFYLYYHDLTMSHILPRCLLHRPESNTKALQVGNQIEVQRTQADVAIQSGDALDENIQIDFEPDFEDLNVDNDDPEHEADAPGLDGNTQQDDSGDEGAPGDVEYEMVVVSQDKQDVFDGKVDDPAATRAVESSLWEF